jgi:hypothetical protein
VTLEIDTSPPPLDVPGGDGKGTMTMEQLVDGMQRINKEFMIPAELLE